MKNIFEKIKEFLQKFKKKTGNTPDRPLFWCAWASVLLCGLVLVFVVAAHTRPAEENPIQGISPDRSLVLDQEIAQHYAQSQPLQEVPQSTEIPPLQQQTPTPSPGDNGQTQATGAPVTAVPAATATPSPGNGLTVYASELPTYQWNIPDDQRPTPLPPASSPNTPALSSPPVINCAVRPGETVSQPVVLMDIQASDSASGPLYDTAVTVSCNGNTVPSRYTAGNCITYALSLNPGENPVTVTALDAAGQTTTEARTIHYQIPEAPVITISVEATTAGFGYLIPPTAVALEQGKTIDYFVTDLLAKNGYTYTCSGSVGQNFLLTSIGRAGAFANPMIPDDLKDNLLSDPVCGPAFNETAFQPDNLSQSHFVTGQSGWMFSLNGQYQSMGMSMILPSANDYIRVRFSLAGGKDVGNAFNQDGAYIGWEKEW